MLVLENPVHKIEARVSICCKQIFRSFCPSNQVLVTTRNTMKAAIFILVIYHINQTLHGLLLAFRKSSDIIVFLHKITFPIVRDIYLLWRPLVRLHQTEIHPGIQVQMHIFGCHPLIFGSAKIGKHRPKHSVSIYPDDQLTAVQQGTSRFVNLLTLSILHRLLCPERRKANHSFFINFPTMIFGPGCWIVAAYLLNRCVTKAKLNFRKFE
mmetsp:Transcript_35784/g.74898  ORF Transcript_35784/g.74898 Transcript_35784/m.74898 type:complete len:210 (+) Transcript_35784:648-1277(+)